MKGMITGLTLDSGVNDLAVKFHIALEVSERQVVRSLRDERKRADEYHAAQAIALQTRHILDEMNSKGHVIDSIYMSGKTSLTAERDLV